MATHDGTTPGLLALRELRKGDRPLHAGPYQNPLYTSSILDSDDLRGQHLVQHLDPECAGPEGATGQAASALLRGARDLWLCHVCVPVDARRCHWVTLLDAYGHLLNAQRILEMCEAGARSTWKKADQPAPPDGPAPDHLLDYAALLERLGGPVYASRHVNRDCHLPTIEQKLLEDPLEGEDAARASAVWDRIQQLRADLDRRLPALAVAWPWAELENYAPGTDPRRVVTIAAHATWVPLDDDGMEDPLADPYHCAALVALSQATLLAEQQEVTVLTLPETAAGCVARISGGAEPASSGMLVTDGVLSVDAAHTLAGILHQHPPENWASLGALVTAATAATA